MPSTMSKPSTVKTSPDQHGDKPLRRADITAGKLVLRQRSARGSVLKHAIQAETIEGVVRKTIREELRRA